MKIFLIFLSIVVLAGCLSVGMSSKGRMVEQQIECDGPCVIKQYTKDQSEKGEGGLNR